MEPLLTPRQVAHLLGLPVATLYTWVYRRQIPFQKLGRSLRFSPRALSAWLARQAWPGASEGGAGTEGAPSKNR